jgi:SAM-dependent methyltransferase
MSQRYCYEGSELELFSQARNWKSYWSSQIRPFIGARVLDVGAGIGATSQVLCDPSQQSWVALEPDPKLAEEIGRRQRGNVVPRQCEIRVGTLADLADTEVFDSILYIDVLEHIADDRAEFQRAVRHLAKSGFLIVLAPAHQFLFSPFDTSVGHHRRYNKRTLGSLAASDVECVKLLYLDSVGLIASSANRFLRRSGMPTPAQIAVWDRIMVPPSRWVDPLLGYSVGKSILGVWRKRPS